MVFPGLLVLAIDEGIWPPLSATSYRSEIAVPFRRSSQVLTGCFRVINYGPLCIRSWSDRPPPSRCRLGGACTLQAGACIPDAFGDGAPETYFNEVLIAVNLALSLERSAANLKLLSGLPRVRHRSFKFEAALELIVAKAPLIPKFALGPAAIACELRNRSFSPFTTVMMARAMPAAIRPYSAAVAAVSSFKKSLMRFTPGPVPLFCPSKPFWIDNVRVSLAALGTRHSA